MKKQVFWADLSFFFSEKIFLVLQFEFAIYCCAIFSWNHGTWQVLNRLIPIPSLLPCEWYILHILPMISKTFLVKTIDLDQILNSTQQEKWKVHFVSCYWSHVAAKCICETYVQIMISKTWWSFRRHTWWFGSILILNILILNQNI